MDILIKCNSYPNEPRLIENVSVIPRVGDHIDIFFKVRNPKVTKVLLFPDSLPRVDAIIEVE